MLITSSDFVYDRTGKDTPTHRLTHLLRPNVTRPDHLARARASLDTPPSTDLEVSSLASYDSDLVSAFSEESGMSDIPSESEPESDVGHGLGLPLSSGRRASRDALSDIASSDAGAEADVEHEQVGGLGVGTNPAYSSSRDSISSLVRVARLEADAWSVSGASDHELEHGVEALSLSDTDHAAPVSVPEPSGSHNSTENVVPADAEVARTDNEDTPRARRTAAPFRSRSAWDRMRSGSSPSRSPARRGARRRVHAPPPPVVQIKPGGVVKGMGGKGSFYEYLFD